MQHRRTFGRLMLRRTPKHGTTADDIGAAADVPSTVRVLAVADWAGDTGITGTIPFSSGDIGDLMYVSNQGWVCVRIGDRTGWVPADHWRIITDVRPFFQYTAQLDNIFFFFFLFFFFMSLGWELLGPNTVLLNDARSCNSRTAWYSVRSVNFVIMSVYLINNK